MSRIWIPVLAVIAATASTAAVVFYQQNRTLRAELAARGAGAGSRQASTSRIETSRAVRAESPAASTQAKAETAAAPGEELPVAGSDEGGRDNRRDQRAERRERGQELFAQALSDPESRAAMLTRAKGQVDRMLGDYLVKLGLDDERIEMLRTLLAERQLARMEGGMLERGASTDEERAEARTWREAKLQQTEADINALLGADGLKNLQAYVDSAPQRQVVDDIGRRASYLGAPMSAEASNRLLAVVQEANETHPLAPLPGRGRWNGNDGSGGGNNREPVTAESVGKYLADLRTRNQEVVEAARAFLTNSQLEALVDQQLDEVQQAEAQLNFMLRNPDARGLGGGFGPGGGGRGRAPGG